MTTLRVAVTPIAAAAVIVFSAGAAQALPSQQPDSTYMVNGQVRALVQVGTRVWVGGKFTEVLNDNGQQVRSVDNLAVFDDSNGALDTGVHIPSVTSSKTASYVYDMSLGANGTLYIAGAFDHVDGSSRSNVAGIDPVTGNLTSFSAHAPKSYSVYAGPTSLYVGSNKLLSFQYNGSATSGYTAPTVFTDSSLRAHTTRPNFRDVTEVGNTVVAACQCDSLKDSKGTFPVKAVVELDGGSGNLTSWTPSALQKDSAAFGLGVTVAVDPANGSPTVYLAAGGSDFTAAYDFSSGAQRWKTDTSGSSQAITSFQGDMVVGGHFDWTASPGTAQCGSNSNPNTNCYHTPKLVAMNAGSGSVRIDQSTNKPWNPGICCLYNGVWSVLTSSSGNSLYVGGEFTKAGGQWSLSSGKWTLVNSSKHEYFARFS